MIALQVQRVCDLKAFADDLGVIKKHVKSKRDMRVRNEKVLT
jgi:hypothetical protein